MVSQQFVGWKAKDVEAQKKIDAKRRELEALKVSFDMSYIAKLAADEASHEQSVKNLKSWQPHLADLRKQRANALKERWQARDRVTMLRAAFDDSASAALKEALSDLQMSLKYAANAFPGHQSANYSAMGWRANQAACELAVEHLTVPKLLERSDAEDPDSDHRHQDTGRRGSIRPRGRRIES